jgi:uncharacterized membrane protein YraQ (UPF0718 family)
MSIALTIFLWMLVAALAAVTARGGTEKLISGARTGAIAFVRLIPRLAIGILGAGYLAEMLPQDLVGRWLGPESGMLGTLIASVAGALTPGGPVVGFSIGAAALKGGASAPQVIAYTTAWALFALPRILMYEIPMMPARLVWLRALVSLPLPFIAAGMAMLIGKP